MKNHLHTAQVGDLVAAFTPPPTTVAGLALYAEASGDSNPLHLDLVFARSAGFDNLVVHGMLGMAHMGRLLTDTFGTEAIQVFDARFTAVVLAGAKVCYEARLSGVDGDSWSLALTATTEAGLLAITGAARVKMACGPAE
jgi:acyl dehydratase